MDRKEKVAIAHSLYTGIEGQSIQYRVDHMRLAELVLDGVTWKELQHRPELDRWPETYSWLKGKFQRRIR